MTQEEKAKRYDDVINKLRYLIKQGIYPLITMANVEDYFPEIKESEDERVRKAILEGIIDCRDAPDLGWSNFGGIEIDDCIAWLEKKCNKLQGKSALEAILEEKVDNANKIEPKDYSSIDPHFGKPIDKVGPKFHEGEWTVSKLDRKARQISEVHFDEYNSYYVVNGEDVNLEEYDRLHHLWTIQDAKDGDVLANKNGAIFINAGSSNGGGTLDCYCYLSVQNEFCIEEHKTGSWFYKDDIKPATKEQCDLLFQRMKEAGCEWDAEKKRIKEGGSKMTREEEMQKLIDEENGIVNYGSSDYQVGVCDGVRLADKTMIEKACEYLRTHLWQSVDADNDPIVESVHNITLDNFIKDFKRYLGE